MKEHLLVAICVVIIINLLKNLTKTKDSTCSSQLTQLN